MSEFNTCKPDEINGLDEILGDGTAVKRTILFMDDCKFCVRILRKVGYSWQDTKIGVVIDVGKGVVTNEYDDTIAVKWIPNTRIDGNRC